MDYYHRETAKTSVERLIQNLSVANHVLIDAIRMIDREIGGLLAHPKSPYFNDYRTHATIIFPSGLEGTKPGFDIILILNKEKTSLVFHGCQREIVIPKALKNPERGVAHIIGQELALQLFQVRKNILTRLKIDVTNAWEENLYANESAIEELKNYLSPQKKAHHKTGLPTKSRGFFNEPAAVAVEESQVTDTPKHSWLSRICPCIS